LDTGFKGKGKDKIMEFWLGVIFGPFIWFGIAFLFKWIEDGEVWLRRKWSTRKLDKDQKRKMNLERELEKLNERQ